MQGAALDRQYYWRDVCRGELHNRPSCRGSQCRTVRRNLARARPGETVGAQLLDHIIAATWCVVAMP
eukprot:scaffold379255_cov39-Prasinocladus_malaysianus.AAC.1